MAQERKGRNRVNIEYEDQSNAGLEFRRRAPLLACQAENKYNLWDNEVGENHESLEISRFWVIIN
jgi:hypothetical protein